LEYIQSTGTQYIDLGLTANQDTTIKCRVSNVNSGTQPFIGLSDANNLIYGIGQQSDGNYLFGQYYKTIINNGRIVSDIVGNDGIVRNFELRKNEFYIDNVLIGSITYHTFTTQNTIKLFTLNPSSSKASIKMYNAQVLDGNMNLLRNMIPVLRKSDNEIGMLDLVEGKFYTNAGTGKFTANLDMMYALIQGTPTVQDGRVSGFSSSNYLQSQNNFPLQSTNFELKLRIKVETVETNQKYVAGGKGRTSFIIGITRNSQNTFVFNLYGGNADGTAAGWNKASSEITIDETQFFDVKFAYNGTEYSLYVNDTKVINYLSSTTLYGNAPFGIGKWLSSGSASVFAGTIDLNRSYIKIDDTKYNLQAVVGYTIVGSPTITNGIASRFSASDYLQVAQTTNLVSKNNYEIQVEVILTSNTPAGAVFSVSSAYVDGIQFNNNKFRFQARESDGSTRFYIDSSYILQTNKTYICNVKRKENSITMTLYEDSILVETVYKDLTNITFNQANLNYRLGQNNFTYLENANIILNNTYIKVNNKLWFNGLEA
jgi:hypothetical protein